MNHVQLSSTQESPSIVILGAREWEMELLAIRQRGFYQVCALLLARWELREMVRDFYRRGACEVVLGVWSGGDGASATRQQVRQGEGGWCCRR
jgi:hypothetical protein